MKSKLENAIGSAFDAPSPQRMGAFFKSNCVKSGTHLDFLFEQVGYIRKRVWLCSALLFIAVMFCLCMAEIPLVVVGLVSSALPFISLLSIAELARSGSYNMAELEMPCKHSLCEISLFRLTSLGGFNLLLLLLLVALLAARTDIGLLMLGLRIVLPFILSSYASFFVINHIRVRESIYISSGITGAISAATAVVSTSGELPLLQSYPILFLIAAIVLAVLICSEIKKFMRKTEEMQWSLQLTV